MSWIFFILFTVLSIKIGKKHFSHLNWLSIPLLFWSKIGVAIFFLYVYTFIYGGGELTADAARFFDESKLLYEVFWTNPTHFFELFFSFSGKTELAQNYFNPSHHWFHQYSLLPNDSRNVIRLNTLIHFVSNGELFVHFTFFAFLSFLGGLDLAHWIKKQTNWPMTAVLVVCVLTPSVVFWTSSILKEPLLILGLGLVLRGSFDQLNSKQRLWRLALGFCLTLLFKPYVIVCLVPFLVYYWLIQLPQFKNKTLFSFGYWIALGLIFFGSNMNKQFVASINDQQIKFMNIRDGGLFIKDLEHNYYHVYFENRTNFEIENGTAILMNPVSALVRNEHQLDYNESIQLKNIGSEYEVIENLKNQLSGISLTRIRGNGWTMIKMIPEVLFNTLVRPLPNDNGSWLKFLALLENILLMSWAMLAVFVFPRKNTSTEQLFLLILGGFAFAILLIVGWTTPVLGALVRYKIPATYALVLFLMVKTDWKKIPKFIAQKSQQS